MNLSAAIVAGVAEVVEDPAGATRGVEAVMTVTGAVSAAGDLAHRRASAIEASAVGVEGRVEVAAAAAAAAAVDGHETYTFPAEAHPDVAAGDGAMTGAAGLRPDRAPDLGLCLAGRLRRGRFRAPRVLMEADGPAVLPAPHGDDVHGLGLGPVPRCLGAMPPSGGGLAAVPVRCHRTVALRCPSAAATRRPGAGAAAEA
jgi:hypothetical protein